MKSDPAVLDTEKMRALRVKLGLTQEEAAHRAGLPGRARWNDIENGRHANITLQTLDAIAQALGVHPAELLGMRTRGRGDAETRGVAPGATAFRKPRAQRSDAPDRF